MVPAGAGRFCHILVNSWSFTATAQPQRTTTPKNLWCKSTSQIVRGEHEMAHLPGICTAGAVGMCGLCPLSLSSLRDAPLAQQCPESAQAGIHPQDPHWRQCRGQWPCLHVPRGPWAVWWAGCAHRQRWAALAGCSPVPLPGAGFGLWQERGSVRRRRFGSWALTFGELPPYS